jgi:Sulfotransferase domain
MRPLVIGSPRSGFALLCSIMSELLPVDPPRLDLRQRVLRAVTDQLQFSISKSVEAAFAQRGITADALIYNGNFRTIAGGPKWLKSGEPDRACIRKYLGVRGMNDFTLVIAHPAEVLETDDVVHSHSHPRLWTELAHYDGFTKFASVRNPIGIINSSLFSINALTSEYIQRFMDERDDNDEMRQRLALFKFTNLDFFAGIARHYKGYFEEFIEVADRFTIMRWEDLIRRPADTVAAIAKAAGLPVGLDHAAQIWQRIDHVNLTGAHKHNYRRGKGIVGDWRNWITNRHLEVIRDHGFERVMERFGYGRIEPLDEARYTPFQRQVTALLARGEIFDDYADRDLFGFAFNKSNLDSSAFAFKRYEWKANTVVERSSFTDEVIVDAVWEAAEAAAGELNTVFAAVLIGCYETEDEARRSLAAIHHAAGPIARRMPKACEAMEAHIAAVVNTAFASGAGNRPVVDPAAPPRLVYTWRDYNVVSYLGQFSAIPHAAGQLDLSTRRPETIEGALVAGSLNQLYGQLDALGQS